MFIHYNWKLSTVNLTKSYRHYFFLENGGEVVAIPGTFTQYGTPISNNVSSNR
jgi:hypothetical protein